MVVALRYMDKNGSIILLCQKPFTKKELGNSKNDYPYVIVHENNQGNNIGSWPFSSLKEAILKYRQIIEKVLGITINNDLQLTTIIKTTTYDSEKEQLIKYKWQNRKRKQEEQMNNVGNDNG